MASRATPKTDSRLAARIAALASVGAALIHFAVTPTHWQEWMTSGVFFAVLALFQLAWALLVLARPTVPVLAAGIVANVGSIALWALSRTAGVPFGPHAGEPELVRAAGLCALLLQTYVVLGAAWIGFRRHRAESLSGIGYGMVLAGAGTVVAVAVAVGVTSGLQHGHHAPTGVAEHDHHAPAGVTVGHHEHSPPAAPAPESMVSGPPAAPPAPISEPPHNHDHG